MTKLSQNINIFGDDDVIKFLRLDKEMGHLLSNLRDHYESNRLGLKKHEPTSSCSTKANKLLDPKNMLMLMGDI